MLRTDFRYRALMVCLIIGALAGVAPRNANAVEVLPGVDLVKATVRGPGLPEPVVLDDVQGVQFTKAWIGLTIAPPQIDKPSKEAQIYKVRLSLASNAVNGSGDLLLAWDGKAAWLSGGNLKARNEFVPAPPAAIDALKAVLPDRSTIEALPDRSTIEATSEESSKNSKAVLVVGLLIGLVAVGVIVAFVLRRRQRSAS